MGRWRTAHATECGHEVHLLEDWETPRFCKECKADRDAQWFEKRCEDCGASLRVHRDWDNIPKLCKACKAAHDAKWYEKSCEHCGAPIRAHRDWDHPPRYCPACKSRFAPKNATCDHCGRGFTIPTGTQVKCDENGWELPRKCEDCRELFRQKPFKTIREETVFGNVVFRTYNSIGQLIGESRDETTIFGDVRRRHTSPTGKTTGFTRKKETIFGTPYRETSRSDGSVKSRSTEETSIFGNKYTKSVGGSSRTEHRTRTEESWTGKKYRKTE
jgi:hypothetical protein